MGSRSRNASRRKRRPAEGSLGAFLCADLIPRADPSRRKARSIPALCVAPPREDPKRRVLTCAAGASLALHVLTLVLGAVVLARAPTTNSEPVPEKALALKVPAVDLPEIELPPMHDADDGNELRAAIPREASMPVPAGGDRVARPDTSHAGKGGTPDVSAPALALADRDDRITLSKDMQSSLDRRQVQRLDAGDTRASEEDRRATWEPMELTFFASGKGTVKERRAIAENDPSRGSRSSASPSVAGGVVGAAPAPAGEGETLREPGSAKAGSAVAAAGAGLLHGAEGTDHRVAADVAFARPQVTEARPAVPSSAIGRPKDNVDSDQDVAETVQSLLHASTAGGLAIGAGQGGERSNEAAPGANGDSGAGSKSKAIGTGNGSTYDPDSDDARRASYTREVAAKVHPLWKNAFPRSAALEGRQGRAIIAFVIQSDGRVSSAQVARTSGIPEFDENVRNAVLRAAPFAPIPPRLKSPLTVYLTFDSPNPAVR